nr:EOG090X04O4 [Simocephalus serrulatus]
MGMRLKISLVCICLTLSSFCSAASEDLVIKSAERTIDITSQLVKITHKLTLSNTGKSAVRSFDFPIETKAVEKLSYFKAQLADGKDSSAELKSASSSGKGTLSYKITLSSSLEPGQTVLVGTVFTHHLTPHPAQITQKEKQLVQYRGSAYIYSPYKILSQTTKVLLSSSTVESYTKVKPSSQSDSTITYGPYDNVAPLSEENILIHFENNAPFLSVANLLRHIEVSHWGNIAVEETLDVYHGGAKLKGSFSRFEYQREHSGVSSIKSFKTILPEFAADVYYRDEIGNISTSNLRQEDDGDVSLELRPRFPLFGGWKTHYVVGYNLPSFANLFNSGDEFVLQMDLISHIFDQMIIDDALVRIVLPEGASNIEIETPYAVTRLPDSLHFTYLDVKGRPVVEIAAKNLVENHIQPFKLRYTFSRIVMLQEPLLCVLAFFLLFLTFIVYARLDFSITKDEACDNRLRAAGIAENIRNHYLKRSALFQAFEDQIAKLKTSRDHSAFQAATKNILSDLRAHVLDVPSNLKSDHPSLHDHVTEIQKHEK